jgi:hypothetical protein
MVLSDAEILSFITHGVLVVDNVLTDDEVREAREGELKEGTSSWVSSGHHIKWTHVHVCGCISLVVFINSSSLLTLTSHNSGALYRWTEPTNIRTNL